MYPAPMSEATFKLGATRRTLFAGIGLLLVAIGTVGVFVPGLPTTVFLLAASYFFARSSPRLHRWLHSHRTLGPYLQKLGEDRSMPRRAKWTALLFLWSGVTISWFTLGADLQTMRWVVVGLGLIGSGVILFYVRTAVPERERSMPHAA